MYKFLFTFLSIAFLTTSPLHAESNIFTSDVNDRSYQSCVAMLDTNGLDHALWMQKCLDQQWYSDLYNTRICEVAQDQEFCKQKYKSTSVPYVLSNDARQDEQDAQKARGNTQSGGLCYYLVTTAKQLKAGDFRKCVDENWEYELDKLCTNVPAADECKNYTPKDSAPDLTTGRPDDTFFAPTAPKKPEGEVSKDPPFIDLTTGSPDQKPEGEVSKDPPSVNVEEDKKYRVTDSMREKSPACAALVEDKKLKRKHFKKCKRAEKSKKKLKRYCKKRWKKGKDFPFCKEGFFN